MSRLRLVPVVLVAALAGRRARGARRHGDERVQRHPRLPPRAGPVGRRTRSRRASRTCSTARAGAASSAASTRSRARTDVHVSFDGQLGAPVSPGRTTTRYAFFRAVSGAHRRGAFQPRVGCIPIEHQPALDHVGARTCRGRRSLAATTLRLDPASCGTTTIGCVPGQKLVDSWNAIAFRTVPSRRSSGLADAVQVQRTARGKKIVGLDRDERGAAERAPAPRCSSG